MAETLHKKISRNQLTHPEKYVGKIDLIEARSSWEWSMFKFLDENSSILAWSSEEVVIPYRSPADKKMHRYFPDFYIKYKNYKDEIIEAVLEVKPSNQADPILQGNNPKLTENMSMKSKHRVIKDFVINKEKWNAARLYCSNKGWRFFVLTEKDICFFGKKR